MGFNHFFKTTRYREFTYRKLFLHNKIKKDKVDGSYSVATIIPERQFTLTN